MKSLPLVNGTIGRGRQETAFQRERQYLDRCVLLRQVSPPVAEAVDIPRPFGAKGFAEAPTSRPSAKGRCPGSGGKQLFQQLPHGRHRRCQSLHGDARCSVSRTIPGRSGAPPRQAGAHSARFPQLHKGSPCTLQLLVRGARSGCRIRRLSAPVPTPPGAELRYQTTGPPGPEGGASPSGRARVILCGSLTSVCLCGTAAAIAQQFIKFVQVPSRDLNPRGPRSPLRLKNRPGTVGRSAGLRVRR